MIQITPQMRVLVAIEAADFRRGIDGLAQLCRGTLSLESIQRDGLCLPQPAGHCCEDSGV